MHPVSGLTQLREQQVHISCLGNDRRFSELVSSALFSAGIQATSSIDRNGDFRAEEEIANDIRDAAVLVLLCSEPSLRNRKIRQELHLAWRFDRPIVPVLLQPLVYPDDVVYWLEGAQWIEAFDGEGAWQTDLLLALAANGMSPDGIDAMSSVSPVRRTSVFLPRSDIPAATGRLVGREQELAALTAAVRRHRLVTLTGSGGTGKSRLAVDLANDLQPFYPDGIFFIELGSTPDPGAVPEAVARRLHIEPVGNEPFAAAVERGLRDRRLLLILDNFEHVLDASGFVADLLRSTGSISVLITSRTATSLPGEVEFELGPLALPDAEQEQRPEELAQISAVELFVERARAAHPGFALTPANAEAIATLCALLDGIPLAIELMAGKARLLTPAQMLKRFASGSGLLSLEGGEGRPDRQRTLRDTIEWSVGLLPPQHRRTLLWMGVFRGGATLESIEAVFEGVFPDDPSTDAMSAVESLVQQHLVSRVDQLDAEPRFRMLESIRAFAQEGLEALGEREDVRGSHAHHYLSILQEADAMVTGPEQVTWLRTIDAEYENCRSAMEWAFAAHPHLILGALNGLWTYWTRHGGIYQGLAWFENLTRESGDDDPEVQSKLLNMIGNMALDLGDLNLAETSFQTCRELSATLGNPARQAVASLGIGHVSRYRGNNPAAREWYDSALTSATTLDDVELVSVCLDSIGDTFAGEGEFAKALGLHREAMAILQDIGDPGMLAYSYCRLADIAFKTHDIAESRFNLTNAISLFDDAGDQVGLAYAQVLQSKVERAEGHIEVSRDLVLLALTIRFKERLLMQFVETIEEILIAENFEGPCTTVVSLLAMCERIRLTSASVPVPADARLLSLGKATLHDQMSDGEFTRAWQAGLHIEVDEGVRLAERLLDELRTNQHSSE